MLQKLRFGLLFIFLLALVACGRSTPIFQEKFDPSIYIVQTGDTVYSIAWRYSQDFRDVISWNKLRAPYTIYPGQKLKVRGQSQAGSQVATASNSTTTASTQSGGVTVQPLNKPRIGTTKRALPKPAIVEPAPSKPNKVQPVVSTPVIATPKSAAGWVWPTRGKLLSTFSGSALDRQGIDIKGKQGGQVLASRGGRVVYSGSGMRNFGQLVIIKHSETFLSAYAHNSQLFVKEGDLVKTGQSIARIGVSNAGVAKLHFEIRKNGKPVNPLKYLPN